MGFGVPIDSWLRAELAPLAGDLLLGRRFRERGWFDPAAVQRLYDEHIRSEWDHSARLWALMMLELWAQNFLDRTDAPDWASNLSRGAVPIQ
jgi:asparagine synthase (glutamine-hydrolysing)